MEGQQVPCLSAGPSVPLPYRQHQGRDLHCPRRAGSPRGGHVGLGRQRDSAGLRLGATATGQVAVTSCLGPAALTARQATGGWTLTLRLSTGRPRLPPSSSPRSQGRLDIC